MESNGSYIHSPNTDIYYLKSDVQIKTLQGCIFIGHPIANCSNLTASTPPKVAIKYYNKKCYDSCDSENALREINLTRSIYWNALHNIDHTPLLPWLPAPHKNIIQFIEHWEDLQRNCDFMITEFANSGELLSYVEKHHDIAYKDTKATKARIDAINNGQLRDAVVSEYRNTMRTCTDGTNGYIEFVAFIFQQMVQAISTLHAQGIAHLDVSPENFVLHVEDDQLIVKLIDFGRATAAKPKGSYEYDFSVSTYSGKMRYMSPESALFLIDADAEPYDASKEDIYALGVALYVLLTCSLPYESPFYIEKDEQNEFGYLNGNPKYGIHLNTMRYVRTGRPVNVKVEPNLEYIQKHGVTELLRHNCCLDYVSNDSLDLLNQIFTKRLSIKELIAHPFVNTPPKRITSDCNRKPLNQNRLLSAIPIAAYDIPLPAPSAV
eukprot:28698_1